MADLIGQLSRAQIGGYVRMIGRQHAIWKRPYEKAGQDISLNLSGSSLAGRFYTGIIGARQSLYSHLYAEQQ